jgi:hypothetical protein
MKYGLIRKMNRDEYSKFSASLAENASSILVARSKGFSFEAQCLKRFRATAMVRFQPPLSFVQRPIDACDAQLTPMAPRQIGEMPLRQ